MKKLYTLLFMVLSSAMMLQAQSIDDLKAKQADLDAKRAEAQATADGLAGEIGGLQKEIDILSGWTKGLSGILGFNLDKQKNWVAAPNANSSSSGFGINLTAFANKMSDKTMWRNKGIFSKAWKAVNIDGGEGGPKLFSESTATLDVINISSLYGYRIHPKVALSGLGELNTSFQNIFESGIIDIGIGATWTPTSHLVVVVHPFNYHLLYSSVDGVEGTGALGAKIRADYNNSFNVQGKKINLSSTFTSFFPYADKELPNPTGEGTVGLSEYQWINSISFEIWNGIGVGIGVGLRGAKFEHEDIQNYYNMGLTYNI